MATKRPKKWAHLDDFQVNEQGDYEYRGKTWRWERPAERPAFLRAAWALLACAATCALAAGFVPAEGVGNAFSVLLPYVGSLGGIMLTGSSLLRLGHEGDAIRDYVYASSVERMAPKALFGLVSAAACAVGEMAYVLMHSGQLSSPFALLYVGLMLGCALCLGLFLKRFGTLTFVEG